MKNKTIHQIIKNNHDDSLMIANFNELLWTKKDTHKLWPPHDFDIHYVDLGGLVDEKMSFEQTANALFLEIAANLYRYQGNENKLSQEIIKIASNVDIKNRNNIFYKSLRKEFLKKNFLIVLFFITLIVVSFIYPQYFYQVIDFIAKFGTSLLITLAIFFLANYRFIITLFQEGSIPKEVYNLKYKTKLQIIQMVDYLENDQNTPHKKLVLVFNNLEFNNLALQKKIVSILHNTLQINGLTTIFNFKGKWNSGQKNDFSKYFDVLNKK